MGRIELLALLGLVLATIVGCKDDAPTVPECRFGSPGCVCSSSTECDAPLACIGGICKAAVCAAGATDPGEGCACASGGTCAAGLTCNEQRFCESEQGREGGACYANRTCDQGLACGTGNVCQSCTFGTAGCACYTNGTCNSGLNCSMGTCTSTSGTTVTPPSSPACHSPCRSSYVDNLGAYRACSVEGLMAGCLDGQTCTNGSCVNTGATAPTCSVDTDCPDFQTCIAGACYSECDGDADCSADKRCTRHTCRLPCAAAGSVTCPQGTTCELIDSSVGFCQADAQLDPVVHRESVDDSFTVCNRCTNRVLTSRIAEPHARAHDA